MLRITVPAASLWDEEHEEFLTTDEQKLVLEHSLISISKWESKWKKAFLDREEKTVEETLDYIRCMTLTPNVNPNVYNALTNENIREINDYITDEMTATTFVKNAYSGPNNETVTSEIIYYLMISLNIPVEFEKWHLNRLLTLIKVFECKNQPSKKMNEKEVLNMHARLNESRKKKLNTAG